MEFMSKIFKPILLTVFILLKINTYSQENINYIKEHDVLTTNIIDATSVNTLTIGQKLQTTTYLDGLGRPVEKVSREVVIPTSGSLWGDAVQFSKYDNKGREAKKYLPYTIQYATTTGTESGKYKSNPITEQNQYYNNTYNETAPYSNINFDNSPLNRVVKVNAPGTSWAASNGEQTVYTLNTADEDIQIWTMAYNSEDVPISIGAYASNVLYKTIYYDENNNRIIEYTNKAGQLILTKQQISDNPGAKHNGWICTYNIYDDFGLLRYVLQPKAVAYLTDNNWSFSGTDAQQVLNELCFRYEYDDKGRCILKKAPGAEPLRIIYDSRDRVVFMQDGNQAQKATPEWTVNLYDDLDRVTMTVLYKTTKSVAQLQTDINNSVTISTITTTTAGDAVNDLVIDKREVAVSNYKARNSIIFTSDDGGNFASIDNDNFTAEIDANATMPSTTATVVSYNNPITSANLNNPAVTTILKYEFYDDYAYSGVKSFDNTNTNTLAYSTSDANVIPIIITKRTLSLPAGSAVRVLGTNTFLKTSNYYDEKGHLIQINADNIKQGQDVTTFQYHFDGRLLSTDEKHSTAYSGYNNFRILTKNVYDKIGRISSIQKKHYTSSFKTIASYDYDDLGRLKIKHLDPDYTGSGKSELESLAYSYNIHNQITGINKDYALKGTGYNKWGNFFGLYLGYDDKDNVFGNAILDGHVSGILWNSQGDDAQRRYIFSYDNAGRLSNAAFTERQKKTDVWDNSKMDFSVSGVNGKIAYDINGNLMNMLQKGVIPGQSAPIDIDKLNYAYTNTTYTYTNKLFKVKDNTTQTSTNGQSGDFKDGTNGSSDDYVYDDNGNLITDNNKKISNISYNFLDKPELITITGKGTIKIVYDAEGNKIQKIFTPQGGGQSVTTTYINAFVYKGDVLQYINFEEGRIRVIMPISQSNGYDVLTIDGNMSLPNGKEGVYDYFIRDYQENVRMILTEEVHTGSNKCTMETARAGAEEPVFGQVDANGNVSGANEVKKTRFGASGIPNGGWNNANIGYYVSKLSLTANKVGPNALLKVMASDVLNATTQYFYANNVTNAVGGTTLPQDILSTLVMALLNGEAATSAVKGSTSGISNQLAANPDFLTGTEPDKNNSVGTSPKAYLTILFFDERFNYIKDASQYLRTTGAAGTDNLSLTLANVKAPKNGYAYVYVSNESNEPVYFDNLHIAFNRGRIIEEDHYYAYGLKIVAISSQKLPDSNEGNIDNKNLYNDKELFDDADLNWYDYGFRNYDAQIGRFTQLDPLTWDYPFLTNYQYASNDPILNIDLDGLEGFNAAYTGVGIAANQLDDVVVKCVAQKAASSAVGSWAISNTVNVLSESLKAVNSIKNIPNNISNSWQSIKNNVSNNWEESKQSVSHWWNRLKINIVSAANADDRPVWDETLKVMGLDLHDPLSSVGGPELTEFKMVLYQTEKLSVRKLGNSLNKWIDKDGRIIYPPNDGFKGTPRKITLQAGSTFDRYGDGKGRFASPLGTNVEKRALPPGGASKSLIKYRVIKPIENVESGKTLPWFDQIGGGIQYRLPKSIDQLKLEKYIEEIP